MSIEIRVYVCEESMPTRDEWQKAIDRAGLNLSLDQFSTSDHTGFVPAKLDGKKAGFEYFFQPVEPSEEKEVLMEIGNCDRFVSFVWRGNETEARSAMLAAAILTEMTGGVYFDPQGGNFAKGHGVFTMMEEEEREMRDRRMLLAEKKWGTTTSRRCPKCNAPCPEHKARCSVCDFELGRAQ
jgi:hypothetical protein